MHARTTSTDLARWIERQGGHWHVEGEPVLARSLPMPAPASSLVDALIRREGSLALLLPEASGIEPGGAIRPEEIANAAHLVDGQRVFQLAWIDPSGQPLDSWLLCEQRRLRLSAPDIDTARQVLDAFRARAKAT